jgi:hypothetical protein
MTNTRAWIGVLPTKERKVPQDFCQVPSLSRVLRSMFEIFHQEGAKAILGMVDWKYENGYSRD